MTTRLEDACEELCEAIAEAERDDCVSVTVFVNSEGYRYEGAYRSAASLKRDGISMRNIRGDWIAEQPSQQHSQQEKG